MAFGNSQANDLVTEHLLKTVISYVKYIVRENQFSLFLNNLCLPYYIPKSFALLLAFHVARHSYATSVCLANGVSIENVAKMLGHSNIKMTQHYAKVLDSSILKDMMNVKSAINI